MAIYGPLLETDLFGPLFSGIGGGVTPTPDPDPVVADRGITATIRVAKIDTFGEAHIMSTVYFKELIAEEGNIIIENIEFLNSLGVAVIPSANPTWCMSDDDGATLFTGVIGAAVTANLIITGDQLILSDNEKTGRVVDTRLVRYFAWRKIRIIGLIDDTINGTLYTNIPLVLEYVVKIEAKLC